MCINKFKMFYIVMKYKISGNKNLEKKTQIILNFV